MDSTQVNWNELAQDALECGRQAVGEITTLIKGVAPEVWEMCVRQAYAEAIVGWIIFLSLCIITAITLPSGIRAENKIDWNYPTPRFGIGVISGIFLVISFYTDFLMSIKIFINPNYYAIQEFFKMIGAN